jgi:hypothetical protein
MQARGTNLNTVAFRDIAHRPMPWAGMSQERNSPSPPVCHAEGSKLCLKGISIGLVHCDRRTKSATATTCRSNIRKCRRALLWRTRSKLRGESVGGQPCRHWGSPGCLCRWQAVHPPQLAVRQQISLRGTLQRVTKSFSVRRKSLTSAWQRSTFSTRKTPRHPSTSKG